MNTTNKETIWAPLAPFGHSDWTEHFETVAVDQGWMAPSPILAQAYFAAVEAVAAEWVTEELNAATEGWDRFLLLWDLLGETAAGDLEDGVTH